MDGIALTNGTIWPGDGTQRKGTVIVSHGRIAAMDDGPYQGDLPTEDLNGRYLSPGLIDLMVCGAFGCTLAEGDPNRLLGEYLKLGVTSCQACAGCLPWETIAKIAEKVRQVQTNERAGTASLLGAYWEGPFQHPALTGGSLSEYSKPAHQQNVTRLLDLARDVTRMVNVSPGTEGDLEGIRALRKAGIIVSMAHADSTAEHIGECLAAGTSILGHVWNNNQGKLAEPGVQSPTIDHLGLIDDRVRFVHLVCDGTHVHPVLVRLVHRCKGTDRICIVTDSLPGAGQPDGEFTWSDGRTFHKRGGVGRTATGQLAGSALLLPDHLRNFVRFTGVPIQEAIRTVTLNPAVSLGIDADIGLVAPGRRADLALWDEKLRLQAVWKNGKKVEPISERAEVQL